MSKYYKEIMSEFKLCCQMFQFLLTYSFEKGKRNRYRPGVAGAVLQAPPSLIKSFFSSNIFQTLTISNRKRQGADILKEYSSHILCHVSCVKCHVSCVKCHLSRVTCQMSKYFFIHFFKKTKYIKKIYIFKKYILFLTRLDKGVELVVGELLSTGPTPSI